MQAQPVQQPVQQMQHIVAQDSYLLVDLLCGFRVLGLLLGNDPHNLLFPLRIGLPFILPVVNGAEQQKCQTQQEGQKFKGYLVLGLPEVGVDHGAVIEQIIHQGNQTEDGNAAQILVESAAKRRSGILDRQQTHGDEAQNSDDVFRRKALE